MRRGKSGHETGPCGLEPYGYNIQKNVYQLTTQFSQQILKGKDWQLGIVVVIFIKIEQKHLPK